MSGDTDEPIGISSLPPADPITYSHQDCGAPLVRMQRHCGGCGQKIDWDGLPKELSSGGSRWPFLCQSFGEFDYTRHD